MNEMAVRAWAASDLTVIHQTGERDFADFRAQVDRAGLRDDARQLKTSASCSTPRISPSPAPEAPSGSSRPPGRPRSSSRIPMRQPITRRSTRGTSSRAAARSSSPTRSVDRVPALVDELLADPARLAAMREAMLALARPDAAEVIADELVALARGGR